MPESFSQLITNPWIHHTALFLLVMMGYFTARQGLNALLTRLSVWVINWPILQKGLIIRQSEWLSARWVQGVINSLTRGFSFGSHSFLFFVFLVTMLSLVPETKPPTMQLIFWVSRALWKLAVDFTAFIPNLISIITIIIASAILIRFLGWIKSNIQAKRITLPGFYPEWADPTYSLIRFFTVLATIVMIAPYLPIYDSPAFKGISIFLGVLLSLGSSSAISNIFAGMVLIYTRSYQPGDVIECDHHFGTVIEKSMLTTRIRTPKNEDVVIPNATILSTAIINHSENIRPSTGLILHTSITIGYDIPWEKVNTLMITAAEQTDYVLKSPKPFVLQTKLDDFYVAYEINAYTHHPAKRPAILSELHAHIQHQFRDAGLEITSSHYRAYRDGNPTTVPPLLTEKKAPTKPTPSSA